MKDTQIEWANRAKQILINFNGYIDTSQMGTGKTFIALWLAKELKLKLLIICPKILINIWKTEAERYGIETVDVLTYGKLASIKTKQPKHGFLIRSDENNKVRFRATDLYRKIVNEGILLIFDEFHMIKKSKVAKTEASHALIDVIVSTISKSKYGVLSATPLENDIFIFNFLKLIGFIKHDISDGSKIAINEFISNCQKIDDFATNKIVRKYMNYNADLKIRIKLAKELYTDIVKPRISGSIKKLNIAYKLDLKNGLYNINSFVLENLKTAIRKLRYITSKQKIKKNDDVKKDNLKKDENENKNDENLVSPYTQNDVEPEKHQILAEINKLLRKIELYKIIDIARVSSDILSNPNNKLVICLNFIKSIEIIATILKEYKPLILIGSIKSTTERDRIINNFNNNPSNRLLIINIKMSIGINLQDNVGDKPRYMLISPNYDILSIIQSTGRIYRQDTKSNTYIRVFYSKQVPEYSVMTSLTTKSSNIKSYINDPENINLLEKSSITDNYVEPNSNNSDIFANKIDNFFNIKNYLFNINMNQNINAVQEDDELEDVQELDDVEELDDVQEFEEFDEGDELEDGDEFDESQEDNQEVDEGDELEDGDEFDEEDTEEDDEEDTDDDYDDEDEEYDD